MVAPRGQRGNGLRQRRQPSQNTNGSGGGDRYINRGAAKTAAVTGSGRRRCRRPLQNTNGSGGGDRYINRGAAKTAPVTGSGRRRCRRPLHKAGGRYRRPLQEAAVTGGRYRKRTAAEKAAVTCMNNALRQDAPTTSLLHSNPLLVLFGLRGGITPKNFRGEGPYYVGAA